MKQPWVWALAVFLIVGAGSIAVWTRRMGAPIHGASEERPLEGLKQLGKAPEFALTERSGKEIRSADLLGKVWIANFIYTNCPDTCPVQSAEMKALQDRFGREQDLRLVSITVDPKRDTPAVLTQYAARFGADPGRWLFLTGKEDEIFRLAQEGFRLTAGEIPEAKRDASGATHIHSPRFIVVDRRGEIRGYYPGMEKEALQRLGRDLEALLRDAK
ncbi:MAG TPA: SCO family protein [Candidatus Binatia bacterium]